MQVPEIRARGMYELARTLGVIAEALAKRTSRPADDLRVRALAGAVVGVMISVYLPERMAEDDGMESVHGGLVGPESAARIDAALAFLESGLPL
jgi:hypothetical protein